MKNNTNDFEKIELETQKKTRRRKTKIRTSTS